MNQSSAPARESVVAMLNTVVRPGCDLSDVDDSVNLIDAGFVDSLALIQIISFLEQEHGLRLYELGVDPAELASLEGVLAVIERGQA